MTIPTVHDNGTSKARLIEGYEAASASIEAAYQAVKATAPNGRDYYPQGPAAMEQATAEHLARLKKLDEVRDEIDSIILALDF
jgi:hypothetical protein